MKPITILVTALGLFAPWHSRADVVELKDGKTLTGKYTGGTPGTIRFETRDGVKIIETSQAVALSFGGDVAAQSAPSHAGGADSATAPAAAGVSAAAAGTASGGSISVPAGTPLLVRVVDPVSSRDPQGKRFTATLESDLVVNGAMVAKAGSKVYGRIQSSQQARRYTGQSALDLRLTEIAVGPNLVPITTSSFGQAGSQSVGKAARGAAAGAAIGAIADGGDGAGKGAAIGAAASGLKKGETVTVPLGTLLEFRLEQPAIVTL